MNIFGYSLGLVTKNDIVSLELGLELESGYLVDQANQAKHFVKPLARPAVCLLRKPERLEYWLQRTDWLTDQQQIELLVFLDSIGGLRVRRSALVWTLVWLKRLLYGLHGMRLKINARRFPANAWGIWLAVGSSTLPLCVLVAVVTVGAYGANLPIETFVLGHVIFLLSLFGSTVVHELVHWKLAQHHSPVSQMLVRGLRLGLLHQPLPVSVELRSAIWGPFAGLVSSIGLAIVIWLLGFPAACTFAAVVVGCLHLLSWLPSYGDGQVIIKQWKGNYAPKTSNYSDS